MSLYIENHKESTITKKLLGLISELCKVVGHRIETHKHLFLNTNNVQPKMKLRKQLHLQKHPKEKILRNKFSKRSKRLVH